ncbi:MAG: transposase, partial [Spirochaetales bacterium]|nr:transposase [Spirochaetales bacterium]
IYLSDKGHHFVISYTLKKSNDELKALALDNDTWDKVKYESNSNIISYASKRISHKVTAKVKMSDEEIEEEKLKRADIKSRGRLPKYKEVEVPAVIHITYDERRAKKDYHDRMVSILKLQEKLKYPSRIDSEMRRGQNQWLKKSGSNFELDDEKIAEAEKWDGIYAIITDRQELTTEEVASIYGGQRTIEESFRILKSDLEARPSFVWTQDHIIGHFTLCFLSLSIIRYMQYLLSKGSDNAITEERILTAVNTTTAVVLSSKGTKILVPNNVSQDFIDIAAQLGMKKLEKAMTFVRFRTLTGLHLEANYNFLREFF